MDLDLGKVFRDLAAEDWPKDSSDIIAGIGYHPRLVARLAVALVENRVQTLCENLGSTFYSALLESHVNPADYEAVKKRLEGKP